jgi:hypothetical protein
MLMGVASSKRTRGVPETMGRNDILIPICTYRFYYASCIYDIHPGRPQGKTPGIEASSKRIL